MPVDHDGRTIAFILSPGVALLTPGENLEDAIGRADNALYQSKTEGRHRVTPASSLHADAPRLADAADACPL